MAGVAGLCPKCKAEYGADVLFCPKDGSPLTNPKAKTQLTEEDPYLGLVIANQFRVEQLVGIGAMGRVYRAHQSGIDRQVAIKILHRELLRKPNVSARFQREAKVASRLMHPNVVQVLMIGAIERVNVDVGGEAYLVMEYLDGISLRSALASAQDALSLPRALHIVLQVCDAVGEAHAQGVVHRDLKPENVMLVRRGNDKDFVKVLDFGVARIDWADNTVSTQAGVIFGTARYISPEGAQGERVTAASDVYSIATMLFECLAGRTPFEGDNPVAILVKQTTDAPPELRSIARSSYVPEPIARVVSQNLAKDPRERCQNARDFGRTLVEAARDGGLKVDDLVLRSTLLGAARNVTQMTSMERTRALELHADLAAKLQGAGASIATPPDLEEDGTPGTAPLVEQEAHPPEPESQDPAEAGRTPPASAALVRPPPRAPQETPSPDLVNRTLADVPSSVTHPARGSSTSVNFPDADWEPPVEHYSPGGRRFLLIASCFVAGVILALVGAVRLGVFDEPEPGVEAFARRARAALAASAYGTPPGENVKDITDVALAKWPSDPSILRIRRDAAHRLVVMAKLRTDEDPNGSEHLARLALELDPENADAQQMVAPKSEHPPSKPASPVPSATLPTPNTPRAPRAYPSRAITPAPLPSVSTDPLAPEEGAPSEDTSDASAKPGGRWL